MPYSARACFRSQFATQKGKVTYERSRVTALWSDAGVLEKNKGPGLKAPNVLLMAPERTTSPRGALVCRHDFLRPCWYVVRECESEGRHWDGSITDGTGPHDITSKVLWCSSATLCGLGHKYQDQTRAPHLSHSVHQVTTT